MTAGRGQCSACRYRFRLRMDGTLQAHHLYCGSERQPECEGSGRHPWTPSPDGCGACMAYVAAQPHLIGALASVGMSRGKSTERMIREHLTGFHERGHQEAALWPAHPSSLRFCYRTASIALPSPLSLDGCWTPPLSW